MPFFPFSYIFKNRRSTNNKKSINYRRSNKIDSTFLHFNIIVDHKLTSNSILSMPYKNGDTAAGRYIHNMVKFMNFKDETDEYVAAEYAAGTATFSREDLLSVTDTDVAKYLKLRAYGTADPLPSDMPTHSRSVPG